MRRFSSLSGLVALAFVGCGDNAVTPTNSSLTEGRPFVAISRDLAAGDLSARHSALTAAGMALADVDTNESFYIAIRKSELGQRWFLSAFMKRYFPGAVSYGAARSLGTRVVSFRVQNGRLFLFDASDLNASSDTFAPELIVDAYPIVSSYGPFERLPSSSDYLLIDPTAGLNRFGMLGDAFAQGQMPDRFTTELSFSQRFRSIGDGATWEQIFTGYSEKVPDPNSEDMGEPNQFRASGTLGLSLRRYREGDGYTPTQLPDQEQYFRSEIKIDRNQGTTSQVAAKWNIRRGMRPIRWLLSDQFAQVQADPRFAQYDVIGAVKRGIENWNMAFGFTALRADLASPTDSYAEDDKNYIIFDKDPTFGAAFANWRTNPNTGEIRGASVYFNSIWLESADQIFSDDPATPMGVVHHKPTTHSRPAARTLTWQGMPEQHLCTLFAPGFRGLDDGDGDYTFPPDGVRRTKKEKIELFLTHVIIHEIGHTLGLRHNFKGSLIPTSSSVMEYIDNDDSIHNDKPGAYDVDAIKFLYGLATVPAQQPFCTDGDVAVDPDCTTFDRGSEPFNDWARPLYRGFLVDYLEGRTPNAPNNSLNNVLKYVRAAELPEGRALALAAANELTAVGAVPPEKLAIAGYAQRVDIMSQKILTRLWIDPANRRGAIANDPVVEPGLLSAVLPELRGLVVNADRIRSYQTRRLAVDILKKLQTVSALQVLQAGKSDLVAARAAMTADEQVLVDDLISRIDRAINPYFN